MSYIAQDGAVIIATNYHLHIIVFFDMINVFETKFKEYLKLYYYIGGMPEVVNAYVENESFKEVRKIQKTLLEDYEQDFSKHAPSNIVPRIRQLWNNIPTQLAKENKKFINAYKSPAAV